MSDEGCPQTDWQTDWHLSHLGLLSSESKMISFFRDEVASIFDEMDVEGEGKLTFLQVMGGEESPLENLFRSMDKSASGSITKEVKNSDRGYLAAIVKYPGSLVQSREISNISMHQISCLCLTYQSSLIFYWLLHFQIRTRGEWLTLNLRFDFCRIF